MKSRDYFENSRLKIEDSNMQQTCDAVGCPSTDHHTLLYYATSWRIDIRETSRDTLTHRQTIVTIPRNSV